MATTLRKGDNLVLARTAAERVTYQSRGYTVEAEDVSLGASASPQEPALDSQSSIDYDPDTGSLATV